MILFGQSELSSLKYTPVVLVWLDKRNYEPKKKNEPYKKQLRFPS